MEIEDRHFKTIFLDIWSNKWKRRIKERLTNITYESLRQLISIQFSLSDILIEIEKEKEKLKKEIKIKKVNDNTKDELILPLYWFRKEPLYGFDVILEPGRVPLYVLTRDDIADIEVSYVLLAQIYQQLKRGKHEKQTEKGYIDSDKFRTILKSFCTCYPENVFRTIYYEDYLIFGVDYYRDYIIERSAGIPNSRFNELLFSNNNDINEKLKEILAKSENLIRKISPYSENMNEFYIRILSNPIWVFGEYIRLQSITIETNDRSYHSERGFSEPIELIKKFFDQCMSYQDWLESVDQYVVQLLMRFLNEYILCVSVKGLENRNFEGLVKMGRDKPFRLHDFPKIQAMILKYKNSIVKSRMNQRMIGLYSLIYGDRVFGTNPIINFLRKLLKKFMYDFILFKTNLFCFPFLFEVDLLGSSGHYHFEYQAGEPFVRIYNLLLLYDWDGNKEAMELSCVFTSVKVEHNFLHLYSNKLFFYSEKKGLLDPRKFRLFVFVEPVTSALLTFVGFLSIEFVAFSITLILALDAQNSLRFSSFLFSVTSMVIVVVLRFRPGNVTEITLLNFKSVLLFGLLSHAIAFFFLILRKTLGFDFLYILALLSYIAFGFYIIFRFTLFREIFRLYDYVLHTNFLKKFFSFIKEEYFPKFKKDLHTQ